MIKKTSHFETLDFPYANASPEVDSLGVKAILKKMTFNIIVACKQLFTQIRVWKAQFYKK